MFCKKVAYLHQQMAFLIFQGRGHQQGQDLIEQGTGAKLSGLVRYLSAIRILDDRVNEHLLCSHCNSGRGHIYCNKWRRP